MTQTQSTRRRELIYSAIIDKRERDPIVIAANRATVPLGRGFKLWQRMNAGQHLVWVDDAEGRPRALTPRQAKVLYLALEMTEGRGKGVTMRAMATALQVAPSTVSRALTKLASWGLIAYVVGRGRWAGLVIFRRAKDDGLDRFRKAAQARVRRWSEAARDRVSRLGFNVAPYILGRGSDSLRDHFLVTEYKGATLTAQRPWTVEELREGGII